MTVADRMSRRLVTIDRGASVRTAAEQMCDRRVGSILVMEDDRLTGILTERDVLGVFARGEFDVDVGDVMTAHPDTIEPDDTLEHAAVVMLHGGFRHLPVVEGGRVVGILSMRDLLAPESDAAPRGA